MEWLVDGVEWEWGRWSRWWVGVLRGWAGEYYTCLQKRIVVRDGCEVFETVPAFSKKIRETGILEIWLFIEASGLSLSEKISAADLHVQNKLSRKPSTTTMVRGGGVDPPRSTASLNPSPPIHNLLASINRACSFLAGQRTAR